MRTIIGSIMAVCLALAVMSGCASVNKTITKVDDAITQADQAVQKIEAVSDKATSTIARAAAGVDEAKAKVEALPEKVKAAVVGDKEHTVVRGDTLWGIDQTNGGDGFGWYGIYRQNRDQITDYDLIEPGWHLKWNKLEAHRYENRKRAYDEPAK